MKNILSLFVLLLLILALPLSAHAVHMSTYTDNEYMVQYKPAPLPLPPLPSVSVTPSFLSYSYGYGSRGPQVAELQTLLQSLGYFRTLPSGYYGRVTVRSVQAFQRDHGISATGYLGPNTRRELQRYVMRGYDVPPVAHYMSCMPPSVSLQAFVATDAVHASDTMTSRALTVREKLDSMRASCIGGKLYANGKPIYFYQQNTCWGNAPEDYLEYQDQEEREMRALRVRYNLIVLSCSDGNPIY